MKELGKAHLSHEFPVVAAHPAMGIWGVQHPHTDVRDQGKRHSKKTTLCPPSALHKMPPRHQIQPQSAKGCPGWHQGAAQHKYKIQESMQSLCCDKRSGLNLPPQLMDPQGHPVTSTLSPRTSGHPCSSYIPKGGPQMPVPKGTRLTPKSLSLRMSSWPPSPCPPLVLPMITTAAPGKRGLVHF